MIFIENLEQKIIREQCGIEKMVQKIIKYEKFFLIISEDNN